MFKKPLSWYLLTLAAIAGLTLIGPAEKSLGANVRVVYLHGAWVWAALACFVAAGLAGLAGLLLRRPQLHGWSRALGWAGLIFWISYLPISVWAMETNWNGMFLVEPRFRVAVVFAVGGLLLQVGVALLGQPGGASLANLAYIALLIWVLWNTPNVMHPPSPILNSEAQRIQLYFFGLVGLTLLLAGQTANLLRRAEPAAAPVTNSSII
jgi:hypothetical protein